MTSVIKLQSPFEKIKLTNVSPEIALRRAIILQAIIDASNTGKSKVDRKMQKEAKFWIFGNSKYFKKICEEADLNINEVFDMTKSIIHLHKSRKKKSNNATA